MNKKDDNFENLKKRLEQAIKDSNLNVELGFQEGAHNEQESESSHEKTYENDVLKRIENFNFKPREIRDYLNKYVVKQSEAKKVLSVAICDHYNHVRQCIKNPELNDIEYNKQNIIILGPTGVGKTYLMRTIAKLIGVPFIKADATKFSETGYVGGDVDDIIRDLVKAANGNVNLAQYGIVYIDEIDKIAASIGSNGRDVSGRGVQINLLKLMEESDVNLVTPTDMMGQVQAIMDMQRGKTKERKRSINTRHILFIVSGAFDKLAEIVKKRVDQITIGFGAKTDIDDDINPYLHKVTTQDFIKYGFEPEFIGRLPVRVACDSLKKEDLAKILTESEGSILRQYQRDFAGYGIDMTITKEAIEKVAEFAEKEQTGARGLMTILESVLRNFKFELPSVGVKSFEVSTETIANKDKALKQLLIDNEHLVEAALTADVKRFESKFSAEHELTIKFDKRAIKTLIEESLGSDQAVYSLCEEKFKDLAYGLKIVARNTNKSSFTITKKMVEEPQKEISNWIVESFPSKTLTNSNATNEEEK